MGNDIIQLPAPAGDRVDILFLAGEHSGDQHAALIAGELLERHPEWKLACVGGPALKKAGAQLLYDLTRDSVVGLVEVLRNYGKFKQLFNQLLSWVEHYHPRIVVLVDYPGFNLRFADALARRGISKKGGGDVLVYQYVSPQIWAWKAKRRFRMARVLDELGAIFPFELDCYEDTDLSVHFVGHPFADDAYVNPLTYDPEGPVLLLPGSRSQAVGRIFPIMLETFREYRESGGRRQAVCLFPEEGIKDLLLSRIASSGIDASLVDLRPVSDGTSASCVLTSSGTMSLNCALAGIPGAIIYRAHPMTAWIGRRLIRIKWLGIANLILNRELYPEFLQSDANPKILAAKIAELLQDGSRRNYFEEGAVKLLEHLKGAPSETVARRIERLLGKQS